MPLPIRWAFAITVSVIVVAGMLEKMVESTACTRLKPYGLPYRSLWNRPGHTCMGKVPPLWKDLPGLPGLSIGATGIARRGLQLLQSFRTTSSRTGTVRSFFTGDKRSVLEPDLASLLNTARTDGEYADGRYPWMSNILSSSIPARTLNGRNRRPNSSLSARE